MNASTFLQRFNEAHLRRSVEAPLTSTEQMEEVPSREASSRTTNSVLLTLRDVNSDEDDDLENASLSATLRKTRKQATEIPDFFLRDTSDAKQSFVNLLEKTDDGHSFVTPSSMFAKRPIPARSKSTFIRAAVERRKRHRDEDFLDAELDLTTNPTEVSSPSTHTLIAGAPLSFVSCDAAPVFSESDGNDDESLNISSATMPTETQTTQEHQPKLADGSSLGLVPKTKPKSMLQLALSLAKSA